MIGSSILPLTKAKFRAVAFTVWHRDQRKTIYLGALILGLCGLVAAAYSQKIWHDYQAEAPGHPARFGDFFALWSYAEIMAEHPASQLYDNAMLHPWQLALGMDPTTNNPFPYPPLFLLLVWPLRLMPYDLGYLVWTFGSLAVFAWVVWSTCSRSKFCLIALILAPVSSATIVAGQSGFVAAALITAGLRLAVDRPIISGLLIGLLSYKPQLGLLVPVGLAAAGLWVAFAAACVTAAGSNLIATWIFGWQVWPAWLSMLPTYNDDFDATTANLKIMPTLLANLREFGCPLYAARVLQMLAAIVVAAVVWHCFRLGFRLGFRRAPNRLAVAALLVGTFLATPHAFIYDLPMLNAALVLFVEARAEAGAPFNTMHVIILFLAMIFPVFMVLAPINVPLSAGCLVLVFGMIVQAQSIGPCGAL